jgi:hypothetical protein
MRAAIDAPIGAMVPWNAAGFARPREVGVVVVAGLVVVVVMEVDFEPASLACRAVARAPSSEPDFAELDATVGVRPVLVVRALSLVSPPPDPSV